MYSNTTLTKWDAAARWHKNISVGLKIQFTGSHATQASHLYCACIVAGLFVISKEGGCLESALFLHTHREEPERTLPHRAWLSLNSGRRASCDKEEAPEQLDEQLLLSWLKTASSNVVSTQQWYAESLLLPTLNQWLLWCQGIDGVPNYQQRCTYSAVKCPVIISILYPSAYPSFLTSNTSIHLFL